jgi:hypothetical protein
VETREWKMGVKTSNRKNPAYPPDTSLPHANCKHSKKINGKFWDIHYFSCRTAWGGFVWLPFSGFIYSIGFFHLPLHSRLSFALLCIPHVQHICTFVHLRAIIPCPAMPHK